MMILPRRSLLLASRHAARKRLLATISKTTINDMLLRSLSIYTLDAQVMGGSHSLLKKYPPFQLQSRLFSSGPGNLGNIFNQQQGQQQSYLEQFTVDLTKLAEEQSAKQDPIIGRHEEIRYVFGGLKRFCSRYDLPNILPLFPAVSVGACKFWLGEARTTPS